jgi:DNA-binding GntR family transcriptional regulator
MRSDSPVLSLAKPYPYDWADDELTDGGLVDASRPGYRQVAAGLREQILSGDLPPGTKLRSQTEIAEDNKVSGAIANAAINQLAREGLVRIEHGKPTLVLTQRRWRAAITIRRTSDTVPSAGIVDAAEKALNAAAKSDPAASDPRLTFTIKAGTYDIPGYPVLIVEMTVLAADVALAVARAWGLARDALRTVGGWDLDRPSVTATPA